MDQTALYDLSYGLYVIGTTGENGPTGCIANTVFQITAEPPVIAVSIHNNNYTNACIRNQREFTVSVLTEETDSTIIGQFGFHSGKDIYKFEHVEYKRIINNLPILTKDISSWLHCKVENIVDVGTHTVFIAKVVDGEKLSKQTPMSYAYYHNVIRGAAPKNAPTYRPKEKEQSASTPYICEICKYVYRDGDFDALPDDWECPICGAKKDKFHKAEK